MAWSFQKYTADESAYAHGVLGITTVLRYRISAGQLMSRAVEKALEAAVCQVALETDVVIGQAAVLERLTDAAAAKLSSTRSRAGIAVAEAAEERIQASLSLEETNKLLDVMEDMVSVLESNTQRLQLKMHRASHIIKRHQ